MRGKKILVVGSTNIDFIAKVSHLPTPGETVGDAVYTTAYGGKGANQAIAAVRLGGEVTFATNLGKDAYSPLLIPYFKDNGIDTKYISTEENCQTGVAFIFVANSGENCIAVAPGANGMLKNEKLIKILDIVQEHEILLLQLEIPYQSVEELIIRAHQVGTKVIFNPAPAAFIKPSILQMIDVLILNETEAEVISGIKFSDSTPQLIAKRLHELGSKTVILTIGSKGAYIYNDSIQKHIEAYNVAAVDTTAAGDTFCGAFVAHLMSKNEIIAAVEYATAAAAISVIKLGAQPSIPNKEEVDLFIDKYRMDKIE